MQAVLERALPDVGRSETGALMTCLEDAARLCQRLDVPGLRLEEGVELLAQMKKTARYLDGAKLALIGHISEEQAHRQEVFEASPAGAGRLLDLPGEERTIRETLTSAGGQSASQTGREISQARAATAYPGFRDAMQHGLSATYLDVLTGIVGKDLQRQAQKEEATLLAAAHNEPVEQFRKTVRAWMTSHYPARAEKQAAQESRQEKLSITPDSTGYRLSGWLAATSGTLLKQALRHIVGVPSREDKRHPFQRNAEALTLLAGATSAGSAGDAAGEDTGSLAGARHEILVHVPLDTLLQTEKAIQAGASVADAGCSPGLLDANSKPADNQRNTGCEGGSDCPTTGAGLGRRGTCLDNREELEADLGEALAVISAGLDTGMLEGYAPATLEDGTALAPSQLAQLMCDSSITRAVLSPAGEPLDVSRKQRLFSARQAKAVAARDRYCRYPGCARGPEYGQIHHAQQYSKAGPTTLDNAVLLCYAHHKVIHQQQITITHHQGGFSFTKPNGTRVGTTRHRGYHR